MMTGYHKANLVKMMLFMALAGSFKRTRSKKDSSREENWKAMEGGSEMTGTTSASGMATQDMELASACILMEALRKEGGNSTTSKADAVFQFANYLND